MRRMRSFSREVLLQVCEILGRRMPESDSRSTEYRASAIKPGNNRTFDAVIDGTGAFSKRASLELPESECEGADDAATGA
jgi:hypothetical protein